MCFSKCGEFDKGGSNMFSRLTHLIFVFAFATNVSAQLWAPVNLGHPDDTLQKVYFQSPTLGFAVGEKYGNGKALDSSVVYKTTNGGSTWTRMAFTSANGPALYIIYLYSISCVSSSTCIIGALGYNPPVVSAVILQTTNGGTTWSQQIRETGATGYLFHCSNSGVFYAAAGAIYKSTDSGTTWSGLGGSAPGRGSQSIYCSDTLNCVAVGTCTDTSICHAGGYGGWNGIITRTVDGGINWPFVPSGTMNTLRTTFFASTSVGFAAGDSGVILKTIDSGNTWAIQNSGTKQNLRDIYFINTDTGWAVGDSGTILSTTDGGSSWQTQNSGTTQKLYSIYFVSPSVSFVVGTSGTMLRYGPSVGIIQPKPRKSGSANQKVLETPVFDSRGKKLDSHCLECIPDQRRIIQPVEK